MSGRHQLHPVFVLTHRPEAPPAEAWHVSSRSLSRGGGIVVGDLDAVVRLVCQWAGSLGFTIEFADGGRLGLADAYQFPPGGGHHELSQGMAMRPGRGRH